MTPAGVGPEFVRALIIQSFVDITVLVSIFSIVATCVAKFVARRVSIARLWWSCFHPLYALLLLLAAVLIGAAWSGFYISLAVDTVLCALVLCAALWLTVRDVTRLRRGAQEKVQPQRD